MRWSDAAAAAYFELQTESCDAGCVWIASLFNFLVLLAIDKPRGSSRKSATIYPNNGCFSYERDFGGKKHTEYADSWGW